MYATWFRPRVPIAISLCLAGMVAVVSARSASPSARLSLRGAPGAVSVQAPAEPAAAQAARARHSAGGSWRPHDGTRDLKPRPLDFSRPGLRTIPFWSDSFDYRGLRYTYKMVGTDPQLGSATTVVPVVLIPIRWVFANGEVRDASHDLVDGQTAIQGILRSPIFADYPFVAGGTPVGTTQFGDAFQRANFWNAVSTRSPNYHVRLGRPAVAPTQTVNVPADKVTFETDPDTGVVTPQVDDQFLEDLQVTLIARLGVTPRTLPIVVWGGAVSQRGAVGWHGAYQVGDALQTYIATGYLAQIYVFSDVAALGHEIIEWLDDPFTDNHSAGWNQPFYVGDPPAAHARCDSAFARDLLETADPFENLYDLTNVPITLGDFTYHLPEGAFIDFFTRNPRSRSVNGQYSFFEVARPYGFDTPPSGDCVSGVHSDNTFFAVPGASVTSPLGLNDNGDVVGYYRDAAGTHGFVRSHGYRRVDYPGAVATALTGINGHGDIVGYYVDGGGYPHGFQVQGGRLTPIDVPGAADTIPNGINDDGDIVGASDNTQPITRGFLLKNGLYQAVPTPFGTQSAVAGINGRGTMAGSAWTDPFGAEDGWIADDAGIRRLDFPDSPVTLLTGINRFGETSGYYFDAQGFVHGTVTLLGRQYETTDSYFTAGINNRRQVVGIGYNFATNTWDAFIGIEPLAPGRQ